MSVERRAAARPHGRHLLRSSGLARSIVRDAGVAPGDLVVDVGAGSGMLTRALVDAGARVHAIEPDRKLGARLRRACPGVVVVAADARTVEWPREPFRVVANLPFASAAEICRALLSDPRLPLRSLDAIVEWDFALKRARLWPSTVLGVLWGTWYELRVARRLEPDAFVPRPSVAAAVLQARRRVEPLVDPRDGQAYQRFLREAFRRSPRARELDAHAWARRWQESSARGRTVRAMTRRGRTR